MVSLEPRSAYKYSQTVRVVRAERAESHLFEAMNNEDLTERNIEIMLQKEKSELAKEPALLKFIHQIAHFAGTLTFVTLNTVLFIFWIGFNIWSPNRFDPYPFTFLTMTVSLEAIFLSIFILISQNASSAHSEHRHKLDLQINILTEEEITAVLKLLDRMAERMGVPQEERVEVQSMSRDTIIEKVMDQITEIEKKNGKKL